MIRAEKRIKYERKSKVARLNIDRAITYIETETVNKYILDFIYSPEEPAPPKHPAPHTSHSLIHNMPELDTPKGQLIGALLRDIVSENDVYDCPPG